MSRTVLLFVAFVLMTSSGLFAANRFYVESKTVNAGDTGVKIALQADTDEDRYGFAYSIKYDETKLNVTGVDLAGTAADGAGWNDGQWFNDPGTGKMHGAVVMDIDPPITAIIHAGTGLTLMNIVVNVVAASAGTTTVTPQDGLGTPAGGWSNIMTFKGDVSVHPDLTNAAGTITIQSPQPPAKPTGLTATAGDTKVDLDWADQGDASAGYNVYQGATKLTATPIAVSQFQVTGLANGTEVCFTVTAVNSAGEGPASDQACATPIGGGAIFRRGDANADGKIDLTDAIYVLSYLYQGGKKPPCMDASDPNDDGKIDLTDAIYVLSYLYQGGKAPKDPGPKDCGSDTTVSPNWNSAECVYSPATNKCQ